MRPLGPDDPRMIGEYRLLGVLGAGGMGRVYLGRNFGGRTVAVKVVRPELAGDSTFRMRFEREVTAASRVGGQYTAAVLGADVNATSPWVATSYVAGLSLQEAIADHGPLPEQSLRVLAIGLARALIAVHAAGIIHRDLKPSNVILALDGPKVIDFGIARAADASVLTTTGSVIGSPGFMCPEQVTGSRAIGPSGDVFSLGGVLVYAATGQGPFGEGDTMAMLWRVVQEPARLEGVPEVLQPLLAACLEKDPELRPTPRQIVAQLVQDGEPQPLGWLPGPILEEVSRRAVGLLDLETGEHHGAAGPPSSPQIATRPNVPTFSRGITDQPTAQPTEVRRTAPPASKNQRPLMIFGAFAIGIAVVLAIVVAVTLMGRSSSDNNSTDPAVTETTSETAAVVASGSLPTSFEGEWTGSASDGLATYAIELTLYAGNVGDQVGSSANTGELTNTRCERTETLTGVSETEITLEAKLSGGSTQCLDDGSTSTVTLQPDGSMSYSMSGPVGSISGTLAKK